MLFYFLVLPFLDCSLLHSHFLNRFILSISRMKTFLLFSSRVIIFWTSRLLMNTFFALDTTSPFHLRFPFSWFFGLMVSSFLSFLFFIPRFLVLSSLSFMFFFCLWSHRLFVFSSLMSSLVERLHVILTAHLPGEDLLV